MGEHYKVEIIEGIPDETVSLYHQGEFVDLCRGPHVPSTGRIPAFRLTTVAGAYWGLLRAFRLPLGALIASHVAWDVWIFLIAPTQSGGSTPRAPREL